jgi:hypothetical protein
MQSGELIVIGKNTVTIKLRDCPSVIKCRFRHEHHIVPCNPNHSDSLEYEVRFSRKLGCYVLIIKWEVSGVREILWHSHY